MKRLVCGAVLLITAVALAQSQYKVVFAGKTSSVAGLVVAGKLSLSSKPYADALGSSVSIDSKSKTANFVRNGKTAKVAVIFQKDIACAPAVDVAKGLGLSAVVSGSTVTVTNPTPAAPSTAPSIQGTAQQSGGEGTLGQTYTICKGTDSAINFQITKLEYSVGNYLYDGGIKNDFLASSSKSLVIYATIQNPQSREIFLNGNNVRFSGVDSRNQNVQGDGYWYEQSSMQYVGYNLRPAQKVSIYTRMILDSGVSLPKLIVDDCNNAVWRFDLRGQIAPIPAPFADPNVPDGSSALTFFPAQFGVYYPGKTSFKMDRVEYSTAPWFDGTNPPEGGRWLVLYYTVKNITKAPIGIYGLGGLAFLDQDNISSRFSDWVYLASRDVALNVELQPNQELQLRALIEVEKGVQPKKLRFNWHDSRTAEVDISNIK